MLKPAMNPVRHGLDERQCLEVALAPIVAASGLTMNANGHSGKTGSVGERGVGARDGQTSGRAMDGG